MTAAMPSSGDAMRAAFQRGTGKSCALPQVEVAGKTGSAEDVHNGLPHAWWVCFAPYDKSTIAIAVMVEDSGHDSENAAPIAKRILDVAFPVKAGQVKTTVSNRKKRTANSEARARAGAKRYIHSRPLRMDEAI